MKNTATRTTPVATIPVKHTTISPFNPRDKHANELDNLAASIKQVGMLQPVVAREVDGHFEVIAGGRRLRAARLLKLVEIPAVVRTDLTDRDVIQIAVVENLQREGVHPLDEANGYAVLLKHGEPTETGWQVGTIADVAKRVGKRPEFVEQRLQLITLIDSVQKEMRETAKWSIGAALIVARHTADQQEEIRTGFDHYDHATQREVENYTRRTYHLVLKRAPFPVGEEIVAGTGLCAVCPKRTGSRPGLFPDVEDADTCTDRACFDLKSETYLAALIASAREANPDQLLVTTASWVAREIREHKPLTSMQYDRCKKADKGAVAALVVGLEFDDKGKLGRTIYVKVKKGATRRGSSASAENRKHRAHEKTRRAVGTRVEHLIFTTAKARPVAATHACTVDRRVLVLLAAKLFIDQPVDEQTGNAMLEQLGLARLVKYPDYAKVFETMVRVFGRLPIDHLTAVLVGLSMTDEQAGGIGTEMTTALSKLYRVDPAKVERDYKAEQGAKQAKPTGQKKRAAKKRAAAAK